MKVQWRSGSAPFLYLPDRVNMSHYLSDADVVGSTPTWTMFFVLLLMCGFAGERTKEINFTKVLRKGLPILCGSLHRV